jgi:signal transduction histidine kinase
LSKPVTEIRRSFSPVYLAILSGIILVILIINGLLEINRTQRGFLLLLEREANLILESLQKDIEETSEALKLLDSSPEERLSHPSLSAFLNGLEEFVAEYLVDTAYRVDQRDQSRPLVALELQALANEFIVSAIEFYDVKGDLLKSWPSPPFPLNRRPLLRELIVKKRSVVIDLFGKSLVGEGLWFSIAVQRRGAPGIVALYLDGQQMKQLLWQFATQRGISNLGLREGILYVSVFDEHLRRVAHTDSAFIGKTEEEPFLRDSLQKSGLVSRRYRSKTGESVFEVAKPIAFAPEGKALLSMGYSLKELQPVLSQIKRNVALSIFFFLLFGVLAVTLIWVNQNRYLRRMKGMEDRIRLAERLSSLGHLAAGVAHEIRNPLNAIGMGLQRLRREFVPQEEPKKQEYLAFADVMSKEIRRVNDIVEQFLTLSRPSQLHLTTASLQELLKNLVLLLQEEASSRGIRLQLEMTPELPSIKMDAEKLMQALLNLVKNGLQAIENGGTVRIETRVLKNRIEVSISDTGAGISSDQMEKIFNYYYTTKEKGVGLGLPIAHRIIEAHGGQLTVESQVGSGTKVTIALPVTQEGVQSQRV